MAWLEDLITQLEDEDVGTFGTNIFATTAANVPVLAAGAATLNIITTGGSSPDYTQNDVIFPSYLKPGAQFTARADTFDAAYELADAAFQAVVKVRNKFINGDWYRSIKPLNSELADGGRDERNQARVQFNIVGDYNRRT